MIALVAFSFLYNSPKFFELKTIVPGDMIYDNDGNYGYYATYYGLRAGPIKNNVYYYNIVFWMNFFCLGLIPFALLIVLNALILKVIFTHKVNNKYKQDMQGPH